MPDTPAKILALLLLLFAVVLAVVASFVPPAHARLLALAVACIAAALAIEEF